MKERRAGKEVWQAELVRVVDGDTIVVTAPHRGRPDVHLRLLGIDAPEMKQAYGIESRETLVGLLSGQEKIRIVGKKLDKYRRTLATLYVKDSKGAWSDVSVNRLMAREGAAWHAWVYGVDDVIAREEASARQGRLGLWDSSVPPQAPWEFRHSKKAHLPV